MSIYLPIVGCVAWVPVLIRRMRAEMGRTEWGF
jgi:hypothetical protein